MKTAWSKCRRSKYSASGEQIYVELETAVTECFV